MTAAYVEAAQAALPAGCEVLWTVRLSDGAFDSDAETLTLPGCTAEDAALLPYFPRLTAVDATGSTAYAALYEAAQALPGVAFTYTLAVGDAVLTNADTALTAAGVDDVDPLSEALPYFPALREADLRGGTAPEADLRALRAAFPDVHFRYTVHLDGGTFDSDAETLDLSGVTFAGAQEAVDALSNFPNLTAADLSGTGLSAADGQAVAAALPELAVRYDVPLCGAVFASDAGGAGPAGGAGGRPRRCRLGLPVFPRRRPCCCRTGRWTTPRSTRSKRRIRTCCFRGRSRCSATPSPRWTRSWT